MQWACATLERAFNFTEMQCIPQSLAVAWVLPFNHTKSADWAPVRESEFRTAAPSAKRPTWRQGIQRQFLPHGALEKGWALVSHWPPLKRPGGPSIDDFF